jgi:hypothetical protein
LLNGVLLAFDGLTREQTPRSSDLSSDALEILRGASKGVTNREIGILTGRTEVADKKHLQVVFQKLGACGRRVDPVRIDLTRGDRLSAFSAWPLGYKPSAMSGQPIADSDSPRHVMQQPLIADSQQPAANVRMTVSGWSLAVRRPSLFIMRR